MGPPGRVDLSPLPALSLHGAVGWTGPPPQDTAKWEERGAQRERGLGLSQGGWKSEPEAATPEARRPPASLLALPHSCSCPPIPPCLIGSLPCAW